MPAIDYDRRDKFNKLIELLDARIDEPGDLAYVVARLLSSKPRHKWLVMKQWQASVESASREYERKVIVPYEEQKYFENGEVFQD